MNIELKVHQLIDATNYVDWNVDLSDDEPIPITKSIVDIEKVSDRKSDYTKTIKLPGTANNNKVFSDIFNLNRSVINDSTLNFLPDFNPALKADVTIYKNGIVQIKGYMQLTNITVTDEQKIEYDVIIIGRFANLFQDIAELKLNQLDLSAHNHIYNRTSIEDSWTAPVGTGYVYGMIDYGYVSNETDYYVDYLAPQIYIKTIVDAIFSQSGYRYSSDFFNSERFKRLVFPYCGGLFQYSADEITNRTFEASRITDSGYLPLNQTFAPITEKLPFNNTVVQSNPAGYDNSAFEFTVQSAGFYTFVSTGDFNIRNNSGTGYTTTIHIRVRLNGTSTIGLQTYPSFFFADGTDFDLSFAVTCSELYFNSTDVITVEILFDGSATTLPASIEFKLYSGSRFYDHPSGRIAEDSEIDISGILPRDINQTDFLSSLFKLFNLYIVPDEFDDRKLIIEPRDSFYQNEVVDLTPYVDVQSGVKIMPMGVLKFKSYNYSYQKDTDWTNEIHQDTFIDAYGIRKFKIVNDFEKDEYKTDIIFAPTPLRDAPTLHDRVLSYIRFEVSTGVFKQSAAKPRILYYGGMVDCDPWNLLSRAPASSPIVEPKYPYVGHLDSVSNPQFDLCFGVPTQVQYLASLYTTNNLFNTYHLKNILEITDPDSKVVEFIMQLNEVQQNQLSFRKIYLIDQQYYRLYKLDYNANSNDLTTAQFLKLKTAPDFVGSQPPINGGEGEIEEGDEVQEDNPMFASKANKNGNSYTDNPDTMAYGYNNNIQGDGVINNSNDNFIKGDNATLLGGSGNKVIHDGVTMIGCTDFETYQDGMTVINNIFQPKLFTESFTVYDVSGISTVPIKVVPKLDGYITEVVDSYAQIYFAGGDATPFTSTPLSLAYPDGTTVAGFSSALTGTSTAVRQRAVISDNVIQQSEEIQLRSVGELGTEGTGIILIEVHYRLHPLIY